MSRCPICKQPIPVDPPQRWRPFCSERCQLLDLGRWLDEDYTIPAEPAEHPDPTSALAPGGSDAHHAS